MNHYMNTQIAAIIASYQTEGDLGLSLDDYAAVWIALRAVEFRTEYTTNNKGV